MQGTKMQAFVLAKNAREYEHMLKENHCLVIRNPSLGENRQKVKYVSSALKINLNDNTVVTACNEAVGSEWGFEFVPFDSLVEDPEDDNNSFRSSIDVIGYVVRSFPFAMTINKNQGQSLSRVGLYLRQPVFTHGQLYVSLSRVKTRDGVKLLILDKDGKPTDKTSNVVYKEVFNKL
ncbi:putative DNA helicase [Helianthus annuus]|nr:putative DNA helicase [Helianthus annuus]